MVEHGQTLSAEGVAAVDKYAGYLLADIELVSAVVAEIKSAALVVALNEFVGLPLLLVLLHLGHPLSALLSERDLAFEAGLPLVGV